MPSAIVLRCSLTSLRLSLHFSISAILAAIAAKIFCKSESDGFLEVEATSNWNSEGGERTKVIKQSSGTAYHASLLS